MTNITKYRLPCKEEEQSFLELEDKCIDIASSVFEMWKPFILMKSEQKKDTDISEIEETNCIIVNQKTKDAFSPLLEKGEIELLPFLTEIGLDKFYLLNIIGLIENALDESETDIEKDRLGVVTNIDYIRFKPEAIEGKSIFKIKELPYVIFVSDKLKNICDKNNITGLSFEEDDIFWCND
jgi:hypothetical protein